MDETEEVKARIMAANKAYYSPKAIFRSKQIHRINKIGLYKTLVRPIFCYARVTWSQTQMTIHVLQAFERTTLKRIYDPIEDKGHWLLRWICEVYIFTKV